MSMMWILQWECWYCFLIYKCQTKRSQVVGRRSSWRRHTVRVEKEESNESKKVSHQHLWAHSQAIIPHIYSYLIYTIDAFSASTFQNIYMIVAKQWWPNNGKPTPNWNQKKNKKRSHLTDMVQEQINWIGSNGHAISTLEIIESTREGDH